MRSKAQIGGHPLHPMLIVVPAGGFVITLVFDLMFLATDAMIWWLATIPLIAISVVGALLAAIPGVIDLFTVARKQGAFRQGVIHAIINLAVVGLFVASFFLRSGAYMDPDRLTAPMLLSLVGVLMLGVSGYLGWSMVQSYHVGVWEHPDAKDPDPRTRREEPHRGEARVREYDDLPPGTPVVP